MSDKKNIDRLFQERLKDLDATPNPEVWNAIEAKLKEQNKPKRVIPIWWYASGVAALLLLFLAIGNFIYNANHTTTKSLNIIVDTPISRNIDSENKTTVVSNNKDESGNKSNSELQETIETQPRLKKKENIPSIGNQTINNSALDRNKDALATHNPSKEDKTSISHLPLNQSDNTQEKPTTGTSSNTVTGDIVIDFVKDSQIALNEKEISSESLSEESSVLDTLRIEGAIAATKALPKPDEKTKKWNVNSNLAPVFYGNTGVGSHLDDQFANNSKSGEVNTSYGIGIGYAINKRIKIRSGLNNLQLSFNTNDVLLFENPGFVNSKEVSNLEHISKDNQAQNLTFISTDKVDGITSNSFVNSEQNGTINQNINYFEVPLEIEYNILDTRFGINIIGGFSTFILDDNSIYSEINATKTFIGEATNINDISFSTNFGIGFDYNFSKRFNFNLEPTFKYQLNAFNNTSGNFKPYIIGVYTGFSYKF
ncbi:hypothetical protein ACFFVB_02485 [Formosa undariae]|uniref:Outer membrane protein beta-barrel domain-containing protein n=1 Tax=Formosa undariae TaxID=1325436 RepID=A0ABV5EXM7_9FLAO